MPNQPHLIDFDPKEPFSKEEKVKKAEDLQRLAEHLKEPEFRKIEGFPIGEDEAILALSDPPYYTACPNPFISEILQEWKKERLAIREKLTFPIVLGGNEEYHREPFSADVAEGKNNPFYNAHSYHTKVPHPAIMRYILHYTEPGDIIFDGFCGTGMAGVAAKLCGDQRELEKIGYSIKDNIIYNGNKRVSYLGKRNAILIDLSPIAAFIAYNYNYPFNQNEFQRALEDIFLQFKQEYQWMYETSHTRDEKIKGIIHYVIWSDIVECSVCNEEMVYWDVAVVQEKNLVKDPFFCPNCGAEQTTRKVVRTTELYFDPSTNSALKRSKQVPVQINYSVGKTRYIKAPNKSDLEIISRIDNLRIPYFHPLNEIPKEDRYYKDSLHLRGISHVHQLYTRRNLLGLAALFNKISEYDCSPRTKSMLKIFFTSLFSRLDKLNRYMPKHNRHVGPLVGTLYISWLNVEISVINNVQSKISRFNKIKSTNAKNVISTQSSTKLSMIPDETIDYIFTDPPFGHNLMYSELNHRWEAWFKVFTSFDKEAIVSDFQKKRITDYQRIMEESFSEAFRILKQNHWITIEFHNTKNAIWNAIREALSRTGFIVADVRTLDKKKGTTNQLFYSDIAKHDLIISAYKPSTKDVDKIRSYEGKSEGAWSFVRQHLSHLPNVTLVNGTLEPIIERQPYLLYDRMVAFHIQNGMSIPLSAPAFYLGLKQKFPERDGMYFLPDQVPEYDRARLESKNISQFALFITDEKSAIQWLRQQLDSGIGGEPKSYQSLQPLFLQQLHQAKHEILPELGSILEQNFLQDEQGRWYVPDPNKASDLERVRTRSLLKEFNQYLDSKKKLKQFRTEAIRAGFTDAWQKKDFVTIVEVANKLPETIIQEDPDLLMYYDNASLRVD